MALLGFCGFQDSTIQVYPEFGVVTAGAAQTGRDGSTNGASDLRASKLWVLPTAATTVVFGIGMHHKNVASILGSSSGTYGTVGTICTGASGVTKAISLTLDSTGHVQIRLGAPNGTVLATSSTAITTAQWNFFEVKATINSSSGSIEVRYNESILVSYSGNTGTTANVTAVGWDSGSANTTAEYSWLDDLYVLDTTDGTSTQGVPNNDYLGDVSVKTSLPTAAGDTTAWTPSSGSNWAAVDESPPNTTDYVSATTSGTRDLYTMSDIPTTGTVYGVRLVNYAAKTDAGTLNLKGVIKENSTTTTEAGVGLSTTFSTTVGSYRWKKPSSSTMWTTTDVNGMQAGVEVA